MVNGSSGNGPQDHTLPGTAIGSTRMLTIWTKVSQYSIGCVLLQLMCIDTPTPTLACDGTGDGTGRQQNEDRTQEDNNNNAYTDNVG